MDGILEQYKKKNNNKDTKIYNFNIFTKKIIKEFIRRSLFLFLILATVLISSCYLPRSEPKIVICPKLEQNCFPIEWKGMNIDTSAAAREVSDSFYIFERVQNINTPADEWGLSFSSQKNAILTFTDAIENKAMFVKMLLYNSGKIESGIGSSYEGHIGNFSINGKKVCFATSPTVGIYGNSRLYIATLQGNILLEPQELGDSITYSDFTWDSHPAFSPDGNVIFYASDRPNGEKGTDLWFTIKMPNGKWSYPINCGDVINSRCDELSPFITKDGKRLYFSSSGHETIGGYDIFYSEINPSFWDAVKKYDINTLKTGKEFFSKPKNLRGPLNTKWDELFPSSPDNPDSLLYYSSNQAANQATLFSTFGGFDIYVRRKIYSPRFVQIPKTPEIDKGGINVAFDGPEAKNDKQKIVLITPTYKIEGLIKNARTNLPVPFAEIIIKEIPSKYPSFAEKILKDSAGKYKIVELEKNQEYEVTAQTGDLFYDPFKIRIEGGDTVIVIKSNEKGEYVVGLEKDREFEITAQAKDLFFDTYNINIPSDDNTTVVTKDFAIPEKITLRINFPLDVYDNPYKYTLDSNGVETGNTWQEELNKLAENIKYSKDKISKLILIGHTDPDASVSYNYQLGLNRVNFVIKELIKRGVPEELLEGRSAGELEPLLRRKNESKEIYHKRLRRVELEKVVKE